MSHLTLPEKKKVLLQNYRGIWTISRHLLRGYKGWGTVKAQSVPITSSWLNEDKKSVTSVSKGNSLLKWTLPRGRCENILPDPLIGFKIVIYFWEGVSLNSHGKPWTCYVELAWPQIHKEVCALAFHVLGLKLHTTPLHLAG